MVSFQCEKCDDTIKKPKLQKHLQQCGSTAVHCIDCNTTFKGDTYQSHTSCVSEAEKTQGALYKPNKKAKTEDGAKDTKVETPSKSPIQTKEIKKEDVQEMEEDKKEKKSEKKEKKKEKKEIGKNEESAKEIKKEAAASTPESSEKKTKKRKANEVESSDDESEDEEEEDDSDDSSDDSDESDDDKKRRPASFYNRLPISKSIRFKKLSKRVLRNAPNQTYTVREFKDEMLKTIFKTMERELNKSIRERITPFSRFLLLEAGHVKFAPKKPADIKKNPKMKKIQEKRAAKIAKQEERRKRKQQKKIAKAAALEKK